MLASQAEASVSMALAVTPTSAEAGRGELVDYELIVWQSLTVSGPSRFLPLVLALVAVFSNTATLQQGSVAH